MSKRKTERDNSLLGTLIPGWPGYRTRGQRSGLDPIDTRTEAAHMEGVFLYRLFTLRARTRKPLILVLMFVFGVIPFVSLLSLLIFEFPAQEAANWLYWFYLIIIMLITGTITINFVVSILEILKIIPSVNSSKISRAKKRKKKISKHRKDYR